MVFFSDEHNKLIIGSYLNSVVSASIDILYTDKMIDMTLSMFSIWEKTTTMKIPLTLDIWKTWVAAKVMEGDWFAPQSSG